MSFFQVNAILLCCVKAWRSHPVHKLVLSGPSHMKTKLICICGGAYGEVVRACEILFQYLGRRVVKTSRAEAEGQRTKGSKKKIKHICE